MRTPTNLEDNGSGKAQSEHPQKYRIFAKNEGDEIVISGIAGRFPNSASVSEFEYNIYNKIDMVDDKEARWKNVNTKMPSRCGNIQNLEKFDAAFFQVSIDEANTIDPQGRILLEVAYEAVLDAGINPRSLRGTNTGVYIGITLLESEKPMLYDGKSTHGLAVLGCCRSMLANRISNVLGLHGPSFAVDTACSSSMYALDCAFSALRSGEIDAAIVGGTNLTLHPNVTLQFSNIGILSSDGYCRPLDNEASGYTRSETVTCLFLQRRRDCKRAYCTFVYSKTNSDGFKSEGITYPSKLMQEQLLKEFYDNIGIKPQSIGFVEAHLTGTVVGDPEECAAIDSVLCKDRTEPLLIGSVKSNLGHTEASSGICATIKAIFAFQNGKIAPNINFKSPRKDIPALIAGRLKAVTELEDLKGPYIAVNSFGFGGTNAHILLRGEPKDKQNNVSLNGLPLLLLWSSRTADGLNRMLNDVGSKPLDTEFIGLLHNIQKENIPGFDMRGFGLYTQSTLENAARCIARGGAQQSTGPRHPIVWIFSGLGSEWEGIGASLMKLPPFNQSIQQCHNALKSKGIKINLMGVITSLDHKIVYDKLESMIGLLAVQIGIVEVLRATGVEADYIVGDSIGELGCAYADGFLTADQMILLAYYFGRVYLDPANNPEIIAELALDCKAVAKLLPPAIQIVHQYGATSTTIWGPSENVEQFVAELTAKGVVANIFQHLPSTASMLIQLNKYLRVITSMSHSKKHFSKWISTNRTKYQSSHPENGIRPLQHQNISPGNNFLFEEALSQLPQRVVAIEVVPHASLQTILKKMLPKAVHIALSQRRHQDNAAFFLSALGKIYLNGVDLSALPLYPKIDFPVSRGTKSISPFIQWEHSDDWFVPKFEHVTEKKSGEKTFQCDLSSEKDSFLLGRNFDGKVFIPESYYLQIVWETFSMMNCGAFLADVPVELSGVRFVRVTELIKESNITLTVVIHHSSGNFEVSKDRETVVIGNIAFLTQEQPLTFTENYCSDETILLGSREFYKEFRVRGLHCTGRFRSVVEARSDGMGGRIRWNADWITFIDAMLQVQMLQNGSRTCSRPIHLQTVRIFPQYHIGQAAQMDPNENFFDVKAGPYSRRIVAGGVEVVGVLTTPTTRLHPPKAPVLEAYQFTPLLPAPATDFREAVRTCVQLASEAHLEDTMKIVEVDLDDSMEPTIQLFQEALDDTPIVSGEFVLLTARDLRMPGIHIEKGSLASQQNCMIVVSTNLLARLQWMRPYQTSIKDKGYLMSIETNPLSLEQVKTPKDYNTVAFLPCGQVTIVLLQRIRAEISCPTVIRLSQNDASYSWLEKVQSNVAKKPVLLVAQNEKFNGLIGLVTCLRKEPGGSSVTCVFIDDPSAPSFDLQLPFFADKLRLGLPINVFRNGEWGTYLHYKLNAAPVTSQENILRFVGALQPGDTSSLAWQQGAISAEGCQLEVFYAALNRRDSMLASGQIFAENSRHGGNGKLGFEYSGIGKDGKRYMGIEPAMALATHIEKPNLTWEIPAAWSLAEAASVPYAYSTVFTAFFKVCDIRNGRSILIHSGDNVVGQAAIRVALVYGLEVFTTVGTPQKKCFLLEEFPELKASHIVSSCDTTFETIVAEQTHGQGVDFLLNSLPNDKLRASLRCVARKGHFLEIANSDGMDYNQLDLAFLQREVSMHTISTDQLFESSSGIDKDIICMISEGVNRGIVRPLPITVFQASELSQAFQFVAEGNCSVKVLVRVHEEDEQRKHVADIPFYPRTYFNPNLVFIILGGLGGFGLELTDWMIRRNARKFILSSRRGISDSYQLYRIHHWKSLGVHIEIRTDDISSYEGCFSLVIAATNLGQVGGIFNLAVLLRDATFANQTPEAFKECLAPKALATQFFDQISRQLCPKLEHFVGFSSGSCGRGNAGQTTYGMANSIMERIIENRASDGLPAKIIQWGVIGEVGIVADSEKHDVNIVVGGTQLQRISSCLQALDTLLESNVPIVSSMVVAEKTIKQGDNIVETVMHIMGIRDIKSISMESSFTEIGMDSLMNVEIKNVLERRFRIMLTPHDLRLMSFQKLKEINNLEYTASREIQLQPAQEEHSCSMAWLFADVGIELSSCHDVLALVENRKNSNFTFFIPGLQGVVSKTWYRIAQDLQSPAYMLQLTNTVDCCSIEAIANCLFKNIERYVRKDQSFYLVGYSFGVLVSMELARRLEEQGYHGHVVFIDGSPLFSKELTDRNLKLTPTDESLQNLLLVSACYYLFPQKVYTTFKSRISQLADFPSKLDDLLQHAKQTSYSQEYIRNIILAIYNRIEIVKSYSLNSLQPISSPITLIRSKDIVLPDIAEDYGLSKHTTGTVFVKFIDGDHTSMLINPNLPQIINDFDPNLHSDKE